MKKLYSHKGQSVIEFALLLVFVAIVLLLGLTAFGVSIADSYNAIINSFPS